VFGIGSNLRMRLLDGGVDALLRGTGRLESASGGFTEEAVVESNADVARELLGVFGRAARNGIVNGVKRGVESMNAPRATAEEIDAAFVGGAIPARMTIGDMRSTAQWRSASGTARMSLLARMVARREPTSMSESRALVRQARKLPIDESLLSPGVRRRWREALALVDREDQALRAVGEVRAGYTGHADYGNLGRLRSTLELVGMELSVRAQVERQAAEALHAGNASASEVAMSSASTSVAPHVDDSGWALNDVASNEASSTNPLDEVLSW
jgi:hypothetical protein